MSEATAEITPTTIPTFIDEHGRAKRRAIDLDVTLDQLQVLLEQEWTNGYAPCTRYLETDRSAQLNEPRSNNDQVNEGWRRKICEWSFEVVDHFGFDREVVSIALNYLDRYVANASAAEPVSRREFQLVAVTALYLAIKLHGETDSIDGPRRKLKIGAFVELSRGLFQAETLERKERELLTSLNWRVNPPTTVQFVATLLRLLPEWSSNDHKQPRAQYASTIFEMARYLTELSVCVSNFTFKFKPSTVAFAAILCAMDVAPDHCGAIPYDARVEFLSSIAGATTMVPSTTSVHEARKMLIKLCPSMFDPVSQITPQSGSLVRAVSLSGHGDSDASQMENGGKASPVCVCESPEQMIASAQRKRTRSSF